MADNDPTGVAGLTGATEPLGVAKFPTKEESYQEYKDNANVTERRQK